MLTLLFIIVYNLNKIKDFQALITQFIQLRLYKLCIISYIDN